MRELLHVLAIGVHGIDIEIAVAQGSEDDLLAVARDRGFRVVAGRVRELLQVGTVRVRGENVVSGIHGPDVSLREIRARRTLRAGEVSGRKQNLFAVRIKIAAGGASL